MIVCDEVSSEPDINHVIYCKICYDETQCEEDLWWHLMNNHYPAEVLNHYDAKIIEQKRYCVRKGSPFASWFSTPPISQGGFSRKIS